MAENYKHLYAQMKKMVEQYQDEIVPGLRKMAEELGQRQAASSWISVKDRLPEEGGVVMCRHKAFEYPVFCQWDESDLCWVNKHWTYGSGLITHWMPMPEPPKEE